MTYFVPQLGFSQELRALCQSKRMSRKEELVSVRISRGLRALCQLLARDNASSQFQTYAARSIVRDARF